MAADDPKWERTYAPWSTPQLSSLNGYQVSETFHPYTCDVHSDRPLVATPDGWRCSASGCACSYERSWGWAWTADNSWRQILRDAKADPEGDP